MYKHKRWHADDVRDFTFRIHMQQKVDITMTSFKDISEATFAKGPLDLATSIATLPYDKTDSLGFSYRNGWSGDGYQWGILGSTTQDCQFSLQLTGYGGNAQVDTDVSACTSTQTLQDDGRYKTVFTCSCNTYGKSGGNNTCNYLLTVLNGVDGSYSVA